MSNDEQLIEMIQEVNRRLLRLAIERQRRADYRDRLLTAIYELGQPEEPPCPTT